MRVGHLPHDGEPEPGARPAARTRRPVEAIEQPLRVLVRDAGPVVAHDDAPFATATSIGSSGGPQATALSSRLTTARSSRAGDPRTSVGWRSTNARRRAPPHARDRVGHEHVQADVLDGVVSLAVPAELDEVADEPRELLELRDDVGCHLPALGGVGHVVPREDLDIGPDARQRRSQLVRGIRDEVALRGDDRSSDASISFTVAASRLSSSSP